MKRARGECLENVQYHSAAREMERIVNVRTYTGYDMRDWVSTSRTDAWEIQGLGNAMQALKITAGTRPWRRFTFGCERRLETVSVCTFDCWFCHRQMRLKQDSLYSCTSVLMAGSSMLHVCCNFGDLMIKSTSDDSKLAVLLRIPGRSRRFREGHLLLKSAFRVPLQWSWSLCLVDCRGFVVRFV